MNIRALMEQIADEVTYTAIRSRGPGGQNVNKVSSAALLIWDYVSSTALTQEQIALIAQKLASMINKDNQVYIRSDEFRDLTRNKERCMEKLAEKLEQAFHKPKVRKPTKPTKASRIKNAESKTKRSKIKKLRQKPEY